MRLISLMSIVGLCLMLSATGIPYAADTTVKVDQAIPNFTIKDINGQTRSLTDYTKQGVTVLVFMSAHCPTSNSYNGRYVQLYNEYTKKGVQFVGINAEAPESVAAVVAHAKQHGFQFPILKDERNVIADRLNAQLTPTAYVIDTKGVLRYVGRIDDSPKTAQPNVADLKMALNALLAGQPVAKKETKAFG